MYVHRCALRVLGGMCGLSWMYHGCALRVQDVFSECWVSCVDSHGCVKSDVGKAIYMYVF